MSEMAMEMTARNASLSAWARVMPSTVKDSVKRIFVRILLSVDGSIEG